MWTPVTLAVVSGACQAAPAPDGLGISHGPFVGHVSDRSATVWARLTAPLDQGRPMLVVELGDGAARMAPPRPKPDDAACVEWTIPLPAAATSYRYSVVLGRQVLAGGDAFTVRTAPAPGAPARVSIAFGSCTAEDGTTARVWEQIGEQGAEAVVLLGDAPYIDSTDLAVQQQRYREFAAATSMQMLFWHTPFYAVWDDHDFGANDSDGNLPGKEFSRQAFIQYHANPSYGDGTQGVYTSFRRGPLEVFLLDTRSFAGTGPSPADPGRPSLLGAGQWEWLLRELAASTATFKVLACGIVWNGAVRPFKKDHWDTYSHEREALFRFIGENRNTGVVLVSGDLHRSRVIRHATTGTAGYVLTELTTSPMHSSVLAWNDVSHPGLVTDLGEPNTFMLLVADTTVKPATLEARFLNGAGDVLHVEAISAAALSQEPPPPVTP